MSDQEEKLKLDTNLKSSLTLSDISSPTNIEQNGVSQLLYLTTMEDEEVQEKVENLRIDEIIEESSNKENNEITTETKENNNNNVERINDIPYHRLSTLSANTINSMFFDEEEKKGENIIIKESNNTIQYLSIDLLIKKIILENFFNEHPKLVNGFLNQFSSFFKNDILIKKLINAYYYYLDRKIDKEKLKHLITFFNSVVIEIYEQNRISVDGIGEEISSLLINFYKEIEEDKNYEAIGIKEILNLIETSNPTSYDVEFTRNSIVPRKKSQNVMLRNSKSVADFRKKSEKKNYFCVLDWSDEEIASQLTFNSTIQLSMISNKEFLAAKFLKKEKKVTSPTLVKITQRFDNLILFVIEDILSYDHKPVRAKMIEKWIDIAKKCKEMKNYNDSMSIKSALNHFIIAKLKLSWKYVKRSSIKTLEQLNTFFSCEGNYKYLREEIKSLKNVPFVPYLGILMRDIAFYEEKGKYVTNNKMINFEKIITIQNLLDDFYKFKESAYNIKQIEELSFLSCFITKTEDELEELGDKLEPEFTLREVKHNEKRLTTMDEMFFAKNQPNKPKPKKTITSTNLSKNSNI